ncbi:MAG TPA: hypothetical protein VHM25_27760 [Polyangiaceae bacterium]|jgi:hypothetical protein|nr:hypothetical protein [Polyangiaceae bacterium]
MTRWNGRKSAAPGALALVSTALGALLSVAAAAPAKTAHSFVVLREYGVGTPSRAQPYLDELLRVVAEQNHWPNATGRYFSERDSALTFIRDEKPDFGILSLPAYLALKASVAPSVIGEVSAAQAGGRQYFLVSKQAQALQGCTGHRLATTFAGDAKFVERVVAEGAFRLADFTLVDAKRPLEPLKQVIRDEADCALIDDAQLAAATHIERGSELKTAWRSAALPGMAVIAFPRSDATATKAFKQSLTGLCVKAKQACASVGIDLIQPSSDERYRELVARYSKP